MAPVPEIKPVPDIVGRVCSHIYDCGLVQTGTHREYQYASLPLCIIDSVFSIGVRYSGVTATVERFCERTGWVIAGRPRSLSKPGEHDVTEFLDLFSVDADGQELFGNRQRTSTKNGILKSRACKLFAESLLESGINDFSDQTEERLLLAEAAILTHPGQGSGLSFEYFKMLAGDDRLVKPDRMVQNFIARALGTSENKISARLAGLLVRLAADRLSETNKEWTPLSLDYAIWQHQREARKEVTQ